MLSAYDILNMAQNRDLIDMGQRQSDITQQLRSKYTLGQGMEGGFGQGELARAGDEFRESRANLLRNYQTKRQIIQERERQVKEQQAAQKRAAVLKGVGSLVGAASMFLPGVGPVVGGAIGAGIGAAGDYAAGQPINIDWMDLYKRWKNR